jgi:hypothetical protein
VHPTASYEGPMCQTLTGPTAVHTSALVLPLYEASILCMGHKHQARAVFQGVFLTIGNDNDLMYY